MPTQTEEQIGINISGEPALGGPWVVILYNDEYHGIDEVVLQVQKATGCSLEKAVLITFTAHTEGRAICYDGTETECERVAGVLRQIRLQVETDRAV
ncbi:MAG TPA: ATP-dependent Clp protease adaptor ClpS [Armatimonadota bacterium]|nr:ATP-dependent Clp protease adaptor ClpS [Armatimonadota bacterium]